MHRVYVLICLICTCPAFIYGKVTIEVPLFEGGAGKAFFLECARDYEKIKPDVKVDLYLDPRIQEKIQVRFLEGSFPEISNVSMNYWPLIRNGNVLDLTPYLDGPSWDDPNVRWRDTFLPGTLDTYKDGDKRYGIPFGYFAYVFWYNKSLFRQHGWTTPKTWEELFELCDRIKKTNVAPMAFQGRYPYYATFLYDAAYYHLAGREQWYARQYLAPGSISNDAGVKSIELVRKLAYDYFQPGALGMSHTESQMQFFLGKAAMIPCGAWLKSEMMGKIPDGFELGCFNLPTVAGSKEDPTVVRVGTEPFLVLSKSKHPEVAVDFLRFMTSKAQAGKFARMQDIPTCIRGSNEGNLSKDLDDVVALANQAKASYDRAPGEAYPEMFQVYQDLMYDAIRPNPDTPKQLADAYEEQGQIIRRRKLNPDEVKVNHVWQPIVFLSALALGAIWFVYRFARGLAHRSRTRATQLPLQRLSFGNILLFVAPALVLYTAFVILPSLRSFSWSLREWNGLTNMDAMPFRGLHNFKVLLLQSDDFWKALKNNLFLMLIVPLFVVPLAMFLAACISRGIFGAKLFRIVFFFPNLLGGIAATILWLHLYNPNGGPVNSFLAGIGFESFKTYTWLEPSHLYWSLIPISVWGTVGFNMVLYLAAMESIDQSYYEAATIDGAGEWRKFWTITIPLIWDILAISIVFLVIGGMKAFDVIWLLCNQRPQGDAHVIATRMVQTMFTEFRVGEAAALAVLLFLMVFIGSTATMRGMRREAVES